MALCSTFCDNYYRPLGGKFLLLAIWEGINLLAAADITATVAAGLFLHTPSISAWSRLAPLSLGLTL